MMLCAGCKWQFPVEPWCVCDGCDYEPLSAEEQQQRAGKQLELEL